MATEAAGELPTEQTITLPLVVREVEARDASDAAPFLVLLEQLSDVGHVAPSFFRERLSTLIADPNQVMIVVEDTSAKRVVATGTLVVEPKFIHSAGLAGHLEDVVVDFALRGKGIGRLMVQHLVRRAKALGCYKVILDCSAANVPFYAKCGFKEKEASMSCYFEENMVRSATAAVAASAATDSAAEAHTDAWHIDQARRSGETLRRRGSQLTEIEPETSNGFLIRALAERDFGSNFLVLLGQLTEVGEISEAFFQARMCTAREDPNQHIVVIEDPEAGRIVATGTVFVEQKFIHSAGLAGHIEDVVVDSTIRGKGLGKMLVSKLKEVAFDRGCYKVILDCAKHNIGFYQRCGFHLGHSPVCMARYIR